MIKSNNMNVDISRKGLDKLLSGRIGQEKYISAYYVPQLIENAEVVDSKPYENSYGNAKENIEGYTYLDSDIVIDGKPYKAHIRVRHSNNKNNYYGHTISDGVVEEIKIEPARTDTSKNASGLVNAIGSNASIPQSTQNINTNQQEIATENTTPTINQLADSYAQQIQDYQNGIDIADDRIKEKYKQAQGVFKKDKLSNVNIIDVAKSLATEDIKNNTPTPYKNLQQIAQTQQTVPVEQLQQIAQSQQTATNTTPYGQNTVGSAEYNPNSIGAMVDKYGAIPEGENPNPNRVVQIPQKIDDSGKKTSRLSRTIAEANVVPDEYVGYIEQNVVEGNYSYEPVSNHHVGDDANTSNLRILLKNYTKTNV